MHLLIAGIPASGKSTFARWLVNNHGFFRCPTGEEPGATFLSEIDGARAEHPNVVIDWGFPVGALSILRGLIASGVEPWWFDGDRDLALEAFLARTGHPGTKHAWDVQMTAIQSTGRKSRSFSKLAFSMSYHLAQPTSRTRVASVSSTEDIRTRQIADVADAEAQFHVGPTE